MSALSVCPACGNQGTSPKGKSNSKWLIVFTKPYQSVPQVSWKKKNLTGLDVLRKEFSKVGLDLADFRMAWLNLHEPNKEENCYVAGRDIVLDEAKGKEVVVLVGSEVTEEFCGLSASDTAGLCVDAPALSAKVVFVLPKPEGVFVRGAGVGELRLSCEKLGKVLNNE